MGFFGTNMGYLRSIHSDRELDRLMANRLRELEIDELKAMQSKKNRNHHNIIHHLHHQLHLLEEMEFYLKVKMLRLLDMNKENQADIVRERKTMIDTFKKEQKEFSRKLKQKGDESKSLHAEAKKHITHKEQELRQELRKADDMIRICKDFNGAVGKGAQRSIRDYRNIYYHSK